MYNTHATTKIVFNTKLNLFRVLVAFNTNNVNTKNAVYISGDLQLYTNYCSYNTANIICAAITTAFKTLRINKSNLQITKQAYANMCAISESIVSDFCYNQYQ